MTQKPLRRAMHLPRFLSFPIRRSLEGVSWASLSVEWRPTEDQKQQNESRSAARSKRFGCRMNAKKVARRCIP